MKRLTTDNRKLITRFVYLLFRLDQFKIQHSTWNQISNDQIQKPVVILAANAQFYDTLQASMRTINEFLKNYTVAIYDLRLTSDQLKMVRYKTEENDRILLFWFSI